MAEYPAGRSKMHALHVLHAVAELEAVGELGHAAFALVAMVANAEDHFFYQCPAQWTNERAREVCGFGSTEQLVAARNKAVAAGWLWYERGKKGSPARYWTLIPAPDCSVFSGGKKRNKAPPTDEVFPNYPNTSPSDAGVPASGDAAQRNGNGLPEPKTDPESLHQQFVTTFCSAWEGKYGASYPFNGGKDGSAVKWIRGQLHEDLGRWQRIVAAFFTDPDPWLAERGHGLGILRSQLHRFLAEKPNGHACGNGGTGREGPRFSGVGHARQTGHYGASLRYDAARDDRPDAGA